MSADFMAALRVRFEGKTFILWDEIEQAYAEFAKYDPDTGRVIPSRNSDPATSHAAAAQITVRANTQRSYLLNVFHYYPEGLTDEEAADYALGVSLQSEYSKRCSELREIGYIEPTGEHRTGAAGMQRIVSRITPAGERRWEEINL